MYSQKILALLLFIFSVVMGKISSAAGSTILLSEEAEWPPYTYETEGLATKGLSLELMKAIFSRLDMTVDLKLYPMERCLQQMKEGSRDAITIVTITEERQKFMVYSDAHIITKGFIYYSSERGDEIEWSSYEDLKGYKIGVVSGYNYGVEFKEARKKYALDVSEVNRIAQSFEKVLVGRIDIMMANQVEASEFIRLNPKYKGKLKAAQKPYIEYSYHIGFSKKSEKNKLIPMLNDVIKKMTLDGSINKIISKYFVF